MKKQTMNASIRQINGMVKKGTLLMESPIQRRSGQWGGVQQSLLIHSIMSDYIVPPFYFAKSESGEYDKNGKAIMKSEIVDGLQRITTVLSYINGEWSLDKTTPDVLTDDGPISVIKEDGNGMSFGELPEVLRDQIVTFTFTCYNLEDYTDEEVEEIFFRLNNGVALTKSQQSKSKMGMELARFITDMLNKPFYTETAYFTDAQFRRANDQLTLIQSMALLDSRNGDYELKTGLSEAEMFKYCESLRGNYPEKKREKVEAILDYLGRAFEGVGKEKFMKKINIPMFFLMADNAIVEGYSEIDFYNWFREFADSYKPTCRYATYCGSGSVKTTNTLKRIEIMEESFNAFMKDVQRDNGLAEDIQKEEAPAVEEETIEEVLTEETVAEETVEEETVAENEDDYIVDDIVTDFPAVNPEDETSVVEG